MNKLNFEIIIHSEANHVYDLMLSEGSYREWTKVFNPTSHYIGSWDVGSIIRFIGTDDKGKQGGIIGRIKENTLGSIVVIEYIGIIHGDNEITSGSEVEPWLGVQERYKFVAQGKNTLLQVELSTPLEYLDYFNTTWPKALESLKAICER